MNDLVLKLTKQNDVTIGHRNETSLEIQKNIKNGFVHINFMNTQGETDLCINVDPQKTNLSEVDFANGYGILHIEGVTNLNFHQVQCIADIDMSTRKGTGYLKLYQLN